ncbi:hypothetical protein SLS62_006029 [Diatrype stigma]|uniref:Uncharacterized protein n=1 Tax=Diatrype stigma TaxID=117547 RepID=A0AAN9V1Y1_9PEZI
MLGIQQNQKNTHNVVIPPRPDGQHGAAVDPRALAARRGGHVDEAQRKVVYYLDARATAREEYDRAEYRNEYVHKLALTEDGKKVQAFDAWLDGKLMAAFMEKVQKAEGGGEEVGEGEEK